MLMWVWGPRILLNLDRKQFQKWRARALEPPIELETNGLNKLEIPPGLEGPRPLSNLSANWTPLIQYHPSPIHGQVSLRDYNRYLQFQTRLIRPAVSLPNPF